MDVLSHLLLVVVVITSTGEINVAANVATRTKICLYTSSHKEKCSEIKVGQKSSLLGLEKSKTIKLIIPGWMDVAYSFEKDLRNAYLALQDVNVVTFDWSFYTLNQRNQIIPVGKYLSQFIDWLVSEMGVSVGSIHVIGFSLGAQLAGVVGEYTTVGKIGRITGLDPVGKSFNSSTSGRLDPSDAEFVDVIHTCDGLMGWKDPCGHVDFFPNKGTFNQPGCPIFDFGICSHKRAYKLFIESLTSHKFVSKECGSWADYEKGLCGDNAATNIMGEHVDKRVPGKFYLYTAGQPPYALE